MYAALSKVCVCCSFWLSHQLRSHNYKMTMDIKMLASDLRDWVFVQVARSCTWCNAVSGCQWPGVSCPHWAGPGHQARLRCRGILDRTSPPPQTQPTRPTGWHCCWVKVDFRYVSWVSQRETHNTGIMPPVIDKLWWFMNWLLLSNTDSAMILQQARISWLKVICAGCLVCRFAAAFETSGLLKCWCSSSRHPRPWVLCCRGWEVTWTRAGHCVGVRRVMGGAWCSHMMVTLVTDDLQIMPRVSNHPPDPSFPMVH